MCQNKCMELKEDLKGLNMSKDAIDFIKKGRLLNTLRIPFNKAMLQHPWIKDVEIPSFAYERCASLCRCTGKGMSWWLELISG